VVKGDTVLTSNYSANYPSHLMVGTVAAVNSDPATNFYTIKVKTATNFFSIQFVTVIATKLYNEQTALENQQLKNQ
ncbi:MAG TPA: rod shape-determining protein MreC, partial [Chitinophagaceae bacterium]|nr:rod shape-determining protein MreC [Chitinophagaceae bacterium]